MTCKNYKDLIIIEILAIIAIIIETVEAHI